jgi:hypothetical protein
MRIVVVSSALSCEAHEVYSMSDITGQIGTLVFPSNVSLAQRFEEYQGECGRSDQVEEVGKSDTMARGWRGVRSIERALVSGNSSHGDVRLTPGLHYIRRVCWAWPD